MSEAGGTEQLVIDVVRRLLREQGQPAEQIGPDTDLYACGLDSLDLAVVAIEMEQHTGTDPFARELVDFRTVRELAGLYAPA